MDNHAVDFRLEEHISFWPPEEPDEPLIGNRRANLVKHRFNITSKGNLSHAKSKQNSDKIVHQVWSGEQLVVERSTVELRRTIEDDAQLIWLLRMEYTMMRQKKQHCCQLTQLYGRGLYICTLQVLLCIAGEILRSFRIFVLIAQDGLTLADDLVGQETICFLSVHHLLRRWYTVFARAILKFGILPCDFITDWLIAS